MYLQYTTDTQNEELVLVKPSIFENNGGLQFEYKDDKYYERMKVYYRNYRARMMEQKGEDYWKDNAKYKRDKRKNDPEYNDRFNDYRRNSLKYRYSTYKSKNGFKITKDQAFKLLEGKCYYCGEKTENAVNGIDRLQFDGDYTIDNCVSCCKMCNMMKGALDPITFVKHVGNICIENKLKKNKKGKNKNTCPDKKPLSFKSWRKTRENSKYDRHDIHLTNDDYDKLTHSDCYLCGKKYNGINHRNGIDRVINDEPYKMSNCEACCSQCNYMKNKYDKRDLLDKCGLIYAKCHYGDWFAKHRRVPKVLYHKAKNKTKLRLTKEGKLKRKEELEERRRISKENTYNKHMKSLKNKRDKENNKLKHGISYL